MARSVHLMRLDILLEIFWSGKMLKAAAILSFVVSVCATACLAYDGFENVVNLSSALQAWTV